MADEKDTVTHEFIECDACDKSNPHKRCSRCKCTYYCDATCQKGHWKEHKPYCHDVEVMRLETANLGSAVPAMMPSSEHAETQCAICLSDTLVDPYVLPECNHSFCFGCLSRYFEAVSRLGDGELKCPYCRTTTGDVEEHLLERAMLYLARAKRKDLSADEKGENLNLALEEVERVIASGSDNKYLPALLTKVQILLALDRADDALELLDKIIEVDARNKENVRLINEKYREYEVAMAEGRMDDANRITSEAEEMAFSQSVKRFKTLSDVYLLMAKAKEKLNDWEGASRVYVDKLTKEMDYDDSTPVQHHKMFMGVSRCSYELGEYDKAINVGQAAIRTNRHFPGVHKYVALSLKAKGDLEGARQLMTRAVLYETPWDDDNREEARQLLRELEELED